MVRLIDADALCKELKKRQNAAYNWSAESRAINDLEGEIRSSAALAMLSEVKLTIDAQPTANVRENVKGEWVEKEDYNGDTYYDCSVCGESWTTLEGTPWENGMNFCPNCGAKMVNVNV